MSMTPASLLDAFSVQIYEPPLSLLRTSERFPDLSDPVCVLMLVVDFETEVSMNGITDFIGNSTGRYASQTVQALELIGCPSQAAQLQEILCIATSAEMTHAAIQRDLVGYQEYQVVTFFQVHGSKWSAATSAVSAVATHLDFGTVYERARAFLSSHKATFEAALRPSNGSLRP